MKFLCSEIKVVTPLQNAMCMFLEKSTNKPYVAIEKYLNTLL